VNLETLLKNAQEEAKRLQSRLLECEKAASSAYMQVERLVSYFDKHAKKNQRQAEERKEKSSRYWVDYYSPNRINSEEREQLIKTSYYFSGKADSYLRAAVKVKEFLG